MSKVEGIDRMFLSGTNATFTLKKDAKLDEAAIEKAFKKQGLKFVGVTKKETSRAKAAYVAKTPGLT